MIDCPWCNSQVILDNHVCPECKHEVLPEHLDTAITSQDSDQLEYGVIKTDLSIEDIIADQFKCSKCNHNECEINETAMNGTGLSKIFDIEYLHYLFVSCLQCGFVEIYNPNIFNGNR
jgi:predicted nucleic-acid-binding Zn-ribbon protein